MSGKFRSLRPLTLTPQRCDLGLPVRGNHHGRRNIQIARAESDERLVIVCPVLLACMEIGNLYQRRKGGVLVYQALVHWCDFIMHYASMQD